MKGRIDGLREGREEKEEGLKRERDQHHSLSRGRNTTGKRTNRRKSVKRRWHTLRKMR